MCAMTDQEHDSTGTGAGGAADGLHARLARIEALLDPAAASRRALPAWRQVTRGEQRWAMLAAVCVAVALQLLLPDRLSFRPPWLLPALELALPSALFLVNPGMRFDRTTRWLRAGSLLLVAA